MGAVTPPYVPRFGTGAPTGGAANGTIYFDRSNNYAMWVAFNGAWHQSSDGVVVPLSIVQNQLTVLNQNFVTLGAPPTSGNLLVALCSHNQNNIGVGAGWTQVGAQNGVTTFGTGCYTKTAGVGESATQTPIGIGNGGGGLQIWEIHGGAGLVDVYAQQHDQTYAPTLVNAITSLVDNTLCLSLFTANNLGTMTGGGGLTQDRNVAGGNFLNSTNISGHQSIPTAGLVSPQATAGTQPVGGCAMSVTIK